MYSWEELDDKDSHASSHRLHVPGGWIIRTIIVFSQGDGVTSAIEQTFVSDDAHEWQI
jgi:hypothetical protein